MELIKELDKQGNFLFKYRGTLPIIVLLLGISVEAYVTWKSTTNAADFHSSQYEFVCLAVALLGLFIRILAVGYAQKTLPAGTPRSRLRTI